MPHAVTHFLIPAILVALFRDFYLRKRDRRKFPLHYVLIAGLAGLLPDGDIAVYYVLSFFGFAMNEIHRTFSHTLFVPIIFLALSGIFIKAKSRELGKHKLKLSAIFAVVAFGTFMHLALDGTIDGKILPFYPLSYYSFGINLLQLVPTQLQDTLIPSIDALLLVLWMVYLELRHKISDFI